MTTYTFGLSGRPLTVHTEKTGTPPILTDLNYTYIKTGASQETEVTQKRTDLIPATDIVTTYNAPDAYNRVTDANTVQGGSTLSHYAYWYDAGGNISQSRVGTTDTFYGYNAQNRLCKTAATTVTCPTSAYPYTYNADGDMLTGDGHTLAHNSKSQTTSEDTYADADQTERTAHGAVTFTNWLLGVGTKTVSGIVRNYVRTSDGQLIATATSSTHNYYMDDGQKNTIGLTNSSGTQTATYTYDPYGGHRHRHRR